MELLHEETHEFRAEIPMTVRHQSGRTPAHIDVEHAVPVGVEGHGDRPGGAL